MQKKKLIFKSSQIFGGQIPKKFTCDGKNISPPFEWLNEPMETKSFVLICDDPDAIPIVGHVFTHLVLIDIPKQIHELKEGENFNSNGIVTLKNDFGTIGWGGPCPPKNSLVAHKYRFTLYALNIPKIPKIKMMNNNNDGDSNVGNFTVELFENLYQPYIIDKAHFTSEYKR